MSVKGTLRRTWPVLLAYAVFSAWGLLCLVVSIFLSTSSGGGDVVALFGIVVATILGHVAGNVLGLARFRLAVIVAAFVVLFIGGTFLAAFLGPIGAYALVAMIAALSGYLGVASRLDVVAAWFPLSLAVGAAILWINMHGETDNFYNGSKYAIWSPFTLVCLTGTVFLMLVFLATRNSLGLTAWQEVGRRGGQLGQTPEQEEQVAVARPGRGSIVVLFAFTLVVLGATAALSPYLFRTAEDPDAKNGKSGQHDPKDPKEPTDPKDPKSDQADGDKGQGKGDKGQGKGKGKTGKGKGKGQGRGHGHGSSGKGSSGKGSSGKGSSGHGQSSGGQSSGGQSSGGQSSGGQSSGGRGSSGQGSSGQGSSGHGSSGQGSSGQGSSGQGSSGNGDGDGDGDDGDGDDSEDKADTSPNEPDTEHAKEAASEALRLGAKILMWFLAAAFLLMILIAVVMPPIRRKMLLRHLDRPLWPVPPTARVMNLWRRARAVLADVGIEPEPGETASSFAARATGEVHEKLGCDAPGLVDAAKIVEKIDYAGRGLGAEDANAMRAAVTALVAEIAPRVSFGQKFKNAWGKPPEVEG